MKASDALTPSLVVFVIAWARLLGLFVLAPVLSSPTILMRFRVLFAFAMAICIAPWLSENLESDPNDLLTLGVLLLKEFSLGAVIGILLSIIFACLNVCSQFFLVQIGMGVAEIFDSITNANSSLWSYFFYMIATLIFIELNGLHLLLKAITESYELIPTFDFLDKGELLFGRSVDYFSNMFFIALKMAIPIVATALILSITLGVIGKIAPQANIFILGIPLQLGLGMLFIMITLPFMVVVFSNLIENTIRDIINILSANQNLLTSWRFV